MAIEEIDDYPEKMTEFEMHWGSVNSGLGGTPETELKLAGDFDLAGFSTLKGQVVTALSDQQGFDNDLDFARSDRDQTRADLRQQLIQFRDNVKTLLPGSKYERALPDTPAEQSGQQKLLDAWDAAPAAIDHTQHLLEAHVLVGSPDPITGPTESLKGRRDGRSHAR